MKYDEEFTKGSERAYMNDRISKECAENPEDDCADLRAMGF